MAGLYLGGKVVAPVVTKEVPKEKFGLTSDSFIGDIDENGTLQQPTELIIFDGRGIKNVGDYGLYFKFYKDRNISSIDLSDLEEVTGQCALDYMACDAINLEELDLRNLKKISGNYACRSMCSNNLYYKLKNPPFNKLQIINGGSACSSACSYQKYLTNTGLSNLISISGSNACQHMYTRCYSLLNIELDNLTTISGSGACQYMFSNCTSLTRADFPSLISIDNINAFGTISSNCIFENCTNLTEIHFRADAQTLIESLTGYQYLFGATNATIYFDL